jgi:hypothetical protein
MDSRRHAREGATYSFPSDLHTYERAFRNGWPVSPAERREVIEKCLSILRDPSASLTRQLGACRVIVQADQCNVQRERTDQRSRGQDLREQAGVLRSILATPQGRELLAQLADLPRPEQPSPEHHPPPGQEPDPPSPRGVC